MLLGVILNYSEGCLTKQLSRVAITVHYHVVRVNLVILHNTPFISHNVVERTWRCTFSFRVQFFFDSNLDSFLASIH